MLTDIAWRSFEDRSGTGHAFVNFQRPETAATFAAAWHLSKRFDGEGLDPLKVSVARLQGLQANMSKWTLARLTRVRNPEFLPFVFGRPGPGPRAPGPEPPGQGAAAAARPR